MLFVDDDLVCTWIATGGGTATEVNHGCLVTSAVLLGTYTGAVLLLVGALVLGGTRCLREGVLYTPQDCEDVP